jgi:hypothetical protein
MKGLKILIERRIEEIIFSFEFLILNASAGEFKI